MTAISPSAKTLIVTNEFLPIRAGVASYAYEIAAAFHDEARPVVVIAAHKTAADEDFDRTLSFEVVRMPEPKLQIVRHLARLLAVWRTMARERPSAVIAADWRVGMTAALVARLYHTPLLITAHGSEVMIAANDRLKQRIARFTYSQAVRVMADSRFTRNLLLDIGVRSNNIMVVPLGARPLTTRAEPGDLHAFQTQWELTDRLILLTVARLVRRKGHDLVLKALPRIAGEFPQILYVMVGEGENREELERLATSLGIADHVLFAGGLADADRDKFLDSCRIYVQPSRQEEHTVEGFGLSIVEAMARGRVVIAGKHGGILDVIDEGRTGLLIDAKDPESLAEAVLKVLRNPELSEFLGQNAECEVEQRLNWFRVIRDIDTILSEHSQSSARQAKL